MLIELIKPQNEKPANSFDSALDFMGDNWAQESFSDGTFYVLKGSLSQSLAQTLNT